MTIGSKFGTEGKVMLHIKHAVISLSRDNYRLHRFEDPRFEIRVGKLPKKFRELHGPSKWFVSEVLSDEVSKTLEAIALFVGTERSNGFARDIFEAGKRAGWQESLAVGLKKTSRTSLGRNHG